MLGQINHALLELTEATSSQHRAVAVAWAAEVWLDSWPVPRLLLCLPPVQGAECPTSPSTVPGSIFPGMLLPEVYQEQPALTQVPVLLSVQEKGFVHLSVESQ